jgi:hypothetical protein
LLKSVNIQSSDALVSFHVVSFLSIFQSVKFYKLFHNVDKLLVEAIIQLLEVCLKTKYLQVDEKFFQQKVDMAMENSLSPTVSNIFTEHFKKLALVSAQHKPSLWLRYVEDTFLVWPHDPEHLQDFLSHLSSLRPSIQFTMEIELDHAIT